MPTTATQLKKLVADLQAQKQQHLDAIAEIDQTFDDLGITAPSATKKRGPGRPKMSATAKAAEKTKGRRKRQTFAKSGEQSVLDFIKSKKVAKTSEVNDHWTAEGRKGKADNALGKLVKDKKLKRKNIKGERGSEYRVV